MSTTSLAHDPFGTVPTWDIRSIPPGLLLGKLGREALRQFAEALKPTELTPGHVMVLHLLSGRAVTQQALCDAVGVDPSKLVGLLNDLEEGELIVRRRHPEDRRRHIVEISERGRKRIAAAERAVRAVDEQLLAGLGKEDRAELQRLLSHVAGNTDLADCYVPLDSALEPAPAD